MATPPAANKLIAAIDAAMPVGRLPDASTLPPQSPVGEKLADGDLAAAREMLAFRPLKKAPIPDGFPAFTPVGMIEVKRYPAYRRATGGGFWPLFQHIKTQGIPMTAPVERTGNLSPRGGGGPMAFLYQNQGVGKLGPIDGVTVEDVEPTTYVSLGMRGDTNPDAVQDARRRLTAWLEASAEYQPVGGNEGFRVLGYNSPMVRSEQRYWELQLRAVKITPNTPPTDR